MYVSISCVLAQAGDEAEDGMAEEEEEDEDNDADVDAAVCRLVAAVRAIRVADSNIKTFRR